jgi:hypothetical protein
MRLVSPPMIGTIAWTPRSTFMEDREQQLRQRIALYRGFLDDGLYPHQTEFYLLQIYDSEDELERLALGRRRLH